MTDGSYPVLDCPECEFTAHEDDPEWDQAATWMECPNCATPLRWLRSDEV